MDFVYKASDALGSVCTLITIDFAKAFDAVDHTVAVQWLFDLRVSHGFVVTWPVVVKEWDIKDVFLTGNTPHVELHR